MRWKIVDTKKYRVLDRNIKLFTMSEKEKEQAEQIYKTKGTLDYVFKPTGIGDCVEVVVRTTGEKIDITDYNSW